MIRMKLISKGGFSIGRRSSPKNPTSREDDEPGGNGRASGFGGCDMGRKGSKQTQLGKNTLS